MEFTRDQKPSHERCLLVSGQRDEGPFLLDWVLYHRLIGFDDILIFSNDCSDGSDLLLDRLDQHGLVTHVRAKPNAETAPQSHVAQLTKNHTLYSEADWVLWLDSDEFLNIHLGKGHVTNLTAAIAPNQGMILNWRIFGDGGQPEWDYSAPTIAQFPRAASAGSYVNDPVKCLFRKTRSIKRLYVHRPVFWPKARAELTMIDCDGDTVPDDMLFSKRGNGMPTKDYPKPARTFALAQVNHYAVRTYDVFQLKKYRGSATRPMSHGQDARGHRYRQAFWDRRNCNDVEDRTIMRHLPALSEALSDALAVPDIRDAHMACCDFMRERIARLKDDQN